MELDGFDVEATEQMTKRIANFPSVVRVSRTLMNKRTPIQP
ncbi:MAG: hypothetical protein JWR07_4068 [Nevskia sp.]|nr:hypothetical protein [Nevskia sp.]